MLNRTVVGPTPKSGSALPRQSIYPDKVLAGSETTFSTHRATPVQTEIHLYLLNPFNYFALFENNVLGKIR